MTLALIAGALAACRQQPAPTNDIAANPAAPAQILSFASGSRDRLCYNPQSRRMSLITYAPKGQANCTVRGSLNKVADLIPDGDASCAFHVAFERGGVTIISASNASCSYYCGPHATPERTFLPTAKPKPVTDLAGDPLC